MSPSENRRRRILPIAILLVIIVLLFLVCRRWVAYNHPAPVPVPASPPAVAPTPIPVAPPPAVIPKKNPSTPKPLIKRPVHQTSVAPVVPVQPAAPVPYQTYVPEAPPPPEPQEWSGSDTAIKHDGQIVVRTDQQWTHFWLEHRPGDFSPEVDFTKNMVVGVFAGSRPATQFSISIVGIRTFPDALVVDYQEKTPPTGTFEMGTTIYPFDIKVIPRSNLKVKFNKLNPAAG